MNTRAQGQVAPTRRETCAAAVLALLLGLVLVGRAAWDGELVYCATDTATVQAPWSSGSAPRNAELSDQASAFYPHYVRISERWRAGELPLWNPDLYVGVPLAANAQWGAYDPQVLALVALEAIGGRELFDRGFAWLAVLRVAAAALGAYLLARKLGIGRAGCAVAGLGFGMSGSVVLWLGYSLAHVTPLLPWILLGLEGLRAQRPARAFVGTALAMALAIYGGHPETSFFVGLTAGAWALVSFDSNRRVGALGIAALAIGVLLAMPVLLPFVEYLQNSGALIAHRLASGEREAPDLISLGALLLFAWGVWTVRSRVGSPRNATLALALMACALVYLFTQRGLSLDFVAQGSSYMEGASAWLAFPVLGLALAGGFHGLRGVRCAPRLIGIASVSLLLAMAAPGVIDAWRYLPLAGLAAPVRAACVSALFLPLVAGAALEHVDARARNAAALTALFVLMSWLGASEFAPQAAHLALLDASDEIVVYEELPPELVGEQPARLRGELRGGLALDALELAVVRLVEEGSRRPVEQFKLPGELGERRADGSRDFDFGELDLGLLPSGDWLLRIDFRRDGAHIGSRNAAVVHAGSVGGLDRVKLWIVVLTLAWLIQFGSARESGVGCLQAIPSLVMVSLVLVAGLWFARGWNSAVPRAEHFQVSKTEAFLGANYAGERLVKEAGILPGSTGLLAGLTTIDGYDAMDVASFDGYRAFAMKPGRNPLLDWNAQGMDLESAAFRLFGVRVLLSHSAQPRAGWRLVAGPGHGMNDTEVYVFEAIAALPRAFCVGRLVERDDVLANLAGFEPRSTAFIDDEFTTQLETPFEHSAVSARSLAAERLEYEVVLDGGGLFVVTDQHFPGWRVTVDGEARTLLRVNSIFRGVRLTAGEHVVVFEYSPDSTRNGWMLAGLGLLLVAAASAYLYLEGRSRSRVAA